MLKRNTFTTHCVDRACAQQSVSESKIIIKPTITKYKSAGNGLQTHILNQHVKIYYIIRPIRSKHIRNIQYTVQYKNIYI
jgi:hypothetical protein